jgi:hypothetical protein
LVFWKVESPVLDFSDCHGCTLRSLLDSGEEIVRSSASTMTAPYLDKNILITAFLQSPQQ